MSKLSPLRKLTCEVVGSIWDGLEISLESKNQNDYATVVFSPPKEGKDEEIMLIACEVLCER